MSVACKQMSLRPINLTDSRLVAHKFNEPADRRLAWKIYDNPYQCLRRASSIELIASACDPLLDATDQIHLDQRPRRLISLPNYSTDSISDCCQPSFRHDDIQMSENKVITTAATMQWQQHSHRKIAGVCRKTYVDLSRHLSCHCEQRPRESLSVVSTSGRSTMT
jgi:hypothetical protein